MTDEQKLDWAHVERRLRNASSYWLSTTRADGRPHARPVWGLWLDGAVWFGTGQQSVKGRNLARDPRAVVHLESGDDVVILEGVVEKITDRELAGRVTAAYSEKYSMPVDEIGFDDPESDTGGALYRLKPDVVHAWLEGLFVESQSRWEPPPNAP